MKLSIVIPAKDEEKRLPATLAEICRYIRKSKSIDENDVEVIVVVNNSTDQTFEIVNIFKRHFQFIKAFDIKEMIGKGGAIKYGFEVANGGYIAFIDADGSSSVYELFKLYHELERSDAEIAIADRYSSESTIIGRIPLQRRFFSHGFRTLTKFLFGLSHKDTQCGLKVFKKDVGKFLLMNNQVTGWTFDLNILIMANILGIKVIDVPTIWGYKNESTLKTKSAFKTVSKELYQAVRKYRVGKYNSHLSREYNYHQN